MELMKMLADRLGSRLNSSLRGKWTAIIHAAGDELGKGGVIAALNSNMRALLADSNPEKREIYLLETVRNTGNNFLRFKPSSSGAKEAGTACIQWDPRFVNCITVSFAAYLEGMYPVSPANAGRQILLKVSGEEIPAALDLNLRFLNTAYADRFVIGNGETAVSENGPEKPERKTQQSGTAGANKGEGPVDYSYICDVKCAESTKDYPLHQYFITLTGNYGWEYILSTADYVLKSDFPRLDQLCCGHLGGRQIDMTRQYDSSRGLSALFDIRNEFGWLSIAGGSKRIGGVRITWFNQTRNMKIELMVPDRDGAAAYAETIVRRTFGTADEMKLWPPEPGTHAAESQRKADGTSGKENTVPGPAGNDSQPGHQADPSCPVSEQQIPAAVKPDQTDTDDFDTYVFNAKFQERIYPRVRKDIDCLSGQEDLLSALIEFVPVVDMLFADKERMRTNTKRIGSVKWIAAEIEMLLKTANINKTLSLIRNTESTERLTDAYILLDYHITLNTPADSRSSLNAMRKVRTMIGKELERRFTGGIIRTLPSGIVYAFEHIPEKDTCCVSLFDAAGAVFSVGMAIVRFRITEEEYSSLIQCVGSKTDQWVMELLDKLPKDRFMAARYISKNEKTGKRQVLAFRVELKCATMDDYVPSRHIQNEGVRYVSALDCIYVLFSCATGDSVPMIDGNGCACIFGRKEYVINMISKNEAAGIHGLYFKGFDAEKFTAFVRTWYRFGVNRIKVNNGTDDHCSEIERDDLLPLKEISQFDIPGSGLTYQIIRWKQYMDNIGNPSSRALAATMWNGICHDLYSCVFVVPFRYGDETGDTFEDMQIHTTGAAVQMLAAQEAARQAREVQKNGSVSASETAIEGSVCCLNKDLICGSKEYHFGTDGEEQHNIPKNMHPITLRNKDGCYMCGFTDYDYFRETRSLFKGSVRTAVFTYEDIISSMTDMSSTDDGPLPILGIVINPGLHGLILSRSDIENAAKEKEGPRVIYQV